MTEEKPANSFLWTPPEKIDENVRRMAWLLFLEAWKNWLRVRGSDAALPDADIKEMYRCCLVAAKIARKLELQPTVSIEDVPEDQA